MSATVCWYMHSTARRLLSVTSGKEHVALGGQCIKSPPLPQPRRTHRERYRFGTSNGLKYQLRNIVSAVHTPFVDGLAASSRGYSRCQYDRKHGQLYHRDRDFTRLTTPDLQRLRVLVLADVQQESFRSEATIFTSENKQRKIINRHQALYFARLNGVPGFLWAKQLQLRASNALEPDNAPGRRRQDTSHRDITQGEFNGLSEMDKMKSSRRAGEFLGELGASRQVSSSQRGANGHQIPFDTHP
jgi:hypothetical protein